MVPLRLISVISLLLVALVAALRGLLVRISLELRLSLSVVDILLVVGVVVSLWVEWLISWVLRPSERFLRYLRLVCPPRPGLISLPAPPFWNQKVVILEPLGEVYPPHSIPWTGLSPHSFPFLSLISKIGYIPIPGNSLLLLASLVQRGQIDVPIADLHAVESLRMLINHIMRFDCIRRVVEENHPDVGMHSRDASPVGGVNITELREQLSEVLDGEAPWNMADEDSLRIDLLEVVLQVLAPQKRRQGDFSVVEAQTFQRDEHLVALVCGGQPAVAGAVSALVLPFEPEGVDLRVGRQELEQSALVGLFVEASDEDFVLVVVIASAAQVVVVSAWVLVLDWFTHFRSLLFQSEF